MGPPIRDDLSREPVKTEPFSNEVVRCSFRVDLLGARNKMNDLSMLINNELKCIVAVYIRQSSDEVAGNYLTGAIRDFVGLERPMWLGMRGFAMATSVAGVHIVLNKFAHARPPVVPCD